MAKKIRKSLETVITQFRKIHTDRYDYSNVNYIGSQVKVEIICKIHGSFFQWPNDHINGSGCSKCSGNNGIDQNEFIIRSKNVHGTTYNLDEAIYKSNKEKVKIICESHGDFYINPSDFWNGIGCRECGYKKQLKTKVSKGIINDPMILDDFEKYRREVRNLTEKNYKKFKHLINPLQIKRNKKYHLDHKFSIYEGYKQNIPSDVISHWVNLEITDGTINQSKGIKCSYSLDQLYTLINS